MCLQYFRLAIAFANDFLISLLFAQRFRVVALVPVTDEGQEVDATGTECGSEKGVEEVASQQTKVRQPTVRFPKQSNQPAQASPKKMGANAAARAQTQKTIQTKHQKHNSLA